MEKKCCSRNLTRIILSAINHKPQRLLAVVLRMQNTTFHKSYVSSYSYVIKKERKKERKSLEYYWLPIICLLR